MREREKRAREREREVDISRNQVNFSVRGDGDKRFREKDSNHTTYFIALQPSKAIMAVDLSETKLWKYKIQ